MGMSILGSAKVNTIYFMSLFMSKVILQPGLLEDELRRLLRNVSGNTIICRVQININRVT